ncbi:MAG: type III-A CRISPR-associated RAMP protein Csm4, partial [Synergistaceae bacterium]|nr:type III-A CRISPR-associated RAMP protein Csm4 [Synergistaceae bacterium]
ADLPDFFSYIEGTGEFFPLEVFSDFGVSDAVEKVSIKGLEASNPYSVGVFSFNEGCGLYFIAACASEDVFDRLQRLTVLLGSGGIGGKVSSGYGKFTLAEDPYMFDETTDEPDFQTRLLQRMLTEDAPSYMSLTTSLPRDDELDRAMDGCSYSIRRRGGFIQSATFGDTAKKDTQYFFAAGSVFRKKYVGDIFSVAHGGSHPVYRYSRPIFLGVEYR